MLASLHVASAIPTGPARPLRTPRRGQKFGNHHFWFGSIVTPWKSTKPPTQFLEKLGIGTTKIWKCLQKAWSPGARIEVDVRRLLRLRRRRRWRATPLRSIGPASLSHAEGAMIVRATTYPCFP